jgi:hypothetical protein
MRKKDTRNYGKFHRQFFASGGEVVDEGATPSPKPRWTFDQQMEIAPPLDSLDRNRLDPDVVQPRITPRGDRTKRIFRA